VARTLRRNRKFKFKSESLQTRFREFVERGSARKLRRGEPLTGILVAETVPAIRQAMWKRPRKVSYEGILCVALLTS
jgi:hypothetical protein